MSTSQPLDLARFGQLPRSLRVRANGAELHLLEWGSEDAPPILMLHGMRGHARWFTPVGPALAGQFRALSLDLRGHGESEHAPPYGLAIFSDDVVALVDAMRLERPVLLGHSMGGGVVLGAAARLGQRVRALVLVDSSSSGYRPAWRRMYWRLRDRLRFVLRPRLRRRPSGGPSVFATREESRASFALRPRGTVAAPELLEHLAEHAVRELPDGTFTWRFDQNMNGYLRPQGQAPDISKIRCPVFRIYGGQSASARRLDAERNRALFPGTPRAEVAVIPGAHHHVFLDRPDEFNAVLLRKLATLD